MAYATPLTEIDGQWHFTCDSGRTLLVGHTFDPLDGFQIALMFADADIMSEVTVADARILSHNIRAGGELDVADLIDREILTCDRLNEGWHAIGRPPSGFDNQPRGHA